MKKVVIDLRWIRDKNFDGVPRYIIEVVTRLLTNKESQNQYILLYENESLKALVQENFPKKAKYFKVDFPVLSTTEILTLPRVLKNLNADIFYSPNFLTFPFNGKTKVILTVHDLTQYVSRQTQTANWKWGIFFKFKFQTAYIFKKTEKIITVSNSTKNDLEQLFPATKNKTTVIYPGISGNFFELQTGGKLIAVKQSYKLPEKYILALGRQDPRKNLAKLIEAFHKLPGQLQSNYTLVIGGAKSPKFHPALLQLIEHLKLTDKIMFTGYIPEDDLPALYQNASLFVYPSSYEGFGLPVVESMASGTAVICSNESSLPEAAGSAAILTDTSDSEALAKSIEKILSDEELKKKLADLGKIQARKFSWDHTATEIERLLG